MTNCEGTATGHVPISKIDLFSGRHTVSLIVAALFVIVLIVFSLCLLLNHSLESSIITGFFTLLSSLAGFFW